MAWRIIDVIKDKAREYGEKIEERTSGYTFVKDVKRGERVD